MYANEADVLNVYLGKTAKEWRDVNIDKKGLDQDKILSMLPKEAVVIHDHNQVNYNKEYSFSNIECNVHLLRDLQKTTDHLQHPWSSRLKELLEKANGERN